jgi:hypothetical protein
LGQAFFVFTVFLPCFNFSRGFGVIAESFEIFAGSETGYGQAVDRLGRHEKRIVEYFFPKKNHLFVCA